ncbi:collagen alpha-1(I) chain-like [Symphalangus syndactylus]|uniref:collagen alpha-1(I) chain-like n=1 Tax=Symphalangus syndactylus TaxID=9590 RepID=UPI003003B624
MRELLAPERSCGAADCSLPLRRRPGCRYCSWGCRCRCRSVLHSRTPHLLPAPPGLGPSGARSLLRERRGLTGRLPEPAGGARAQEGLRDSCSGNSLGPAFSSPAPPGRLRPRGADQSREGASPLYGERGASCLSWGSPGDAAALALRPGCPNPAREQQTGRRGAPPPCSLPGAPALGRSDTPGAVGPPQLFMPCFASLWRGRDSELRGLSGLRGKWP